MAARRLRPLHRLGLRNRVALGFALVGLLLSGLLAVAASLLVTRYLNDQQERTAAAQATDNAALLRTKILVLEQPPGTVMNEVQFPPGTSAVLVLGDRLFLNPARPTPEVPQRLVDQVVSGHTKSWRVRLDGEDRLVVGVPLGRHGRGAFFEITSLHDLESTLRALWLILLLGAVGTSLLGLGIGWVASRRLLRPLTEVTAAAEAIAHGDLSARLSPSLEPDLAGLAHSFNRTAERLENRVRSDARFAGDVSHELRTPLTTMLNSLALLQNRRASLPEELAEPLLLLEEDLMRFRRLVVDLLEISRADGGGRGPREWVEVAEVVRRAADAAAGRPVTRVGREVRGLRMPADKRRLERVLTNLVENAEVHGGGCRGVRVVSVDHTLRIEVEDRGPGVPAEKRERIFDRFARETVGGAGTGLGLAIVARHVGWLGGVVRVEDVPGGGARFVVELPTSVSIRG